jgi:ubiquinone/menaquinone biosynthesis C-methylase UbiE
MEAIQAYKCRTFDLLEVKAGHHILDVGCGTGDDVRTLGQLVERSGQVVGVDESTTMITEARKRAEGSNLPVEYCVGDAHNLDFEDNTFDGCRADRTFQLLEHPQKALAEMIRVARSKAGIIISDPDWETLIVDAPNRISTRKILNSWCDSVRNGWMGRQLPALFKVAGLTDVAVAPVTVVLTDYTVADEVFQLSRSVETAQEAGEVSAVEAAAWLGGLEEVGQTGCFFSAITAFIVSGRKP